MSDRSERPEQKDLLAIWRQLYDANEKVWGQATSEFMESPAFAQWQGKMLETFLAFQSAWKDSATARLEAANIATRDDLVRLGELIVGLEEKVDQLGDRLSAATALAQRGPAPKARARGTTKPKTTKVNAKAKAKPSARSRR